jgi:hypothetical protein
MAADRHTENANLIGYKQECESVWNDKRNTQKCLCFKLGTSRSSTQSLLLLHHYGHLCHCSKFWLKKKTPQQCRPLYTTSSDTSFRLVHRSPTCNIWRIFPLPIGAFFRFSAMEWVKRECDTGSCFHRVSMTCYVSQSGPIFLLFFVMCVYIV